MMLASDLHPHRSQHSADHRTEDDTADDRSQHSADHCTRPRPSFLVLLAGSRRDRDAPDVLGGIVKPPGFRCVHWRCLWTQRVPLEGAQYSGSPCQSSSRDSIVPHVAWPTGSCGFPCAHMWQELVRGFQHARRRVAAWSDPAPTAFAWALDTSAGRVAFCSRIDTRTAVSWASRPPRLPPRGNAASRRPGLRYVVRPRGLLVCLTTGRSHTARASRAHLVTAARAGDLLLLANDG